MNINFNVYNQYVKAQSFNTFGKENETAAGKNSDSKQDQVCFSADATAYNLVKGPAKALTTEIAQNGTDARLAELRTQIQNGTYDVPATAVADAILDRIV